jgi:hypothetical protein
MKVKLLVLAAALMMLTSLSFGQGFVACLIDADGHNDACTGGNPIPVGTHGEVWQDLGTLGPDAADVIGPVGSDGMLNWNTFTIDWVGGEIPGGFYTDPCLSSGGLMPTNGRYYVKITLPSGLYWTTGSFTPASGFQEIYLTGWVCHEPPPPSCEPIPVSRAVSFGHTVSCHQDQPAQCVPLCALYPTVHVCVPGLAEGPLPEFIFGNCECGIAGVASGYVWAGTWVWGGLAAGYCNDLILPTGAEDGSVCLILDNILAAEMGNVSILPGDNSVNVKFNTMSETNVTRFDLVRDGNVVSHIAASNTPAGNTYTYVDNGLNNGTTYNYSLVLVRADLTSEVVATQAVTPSMEHAVVTEYALHQNFPNPFNPTTSIRFDLVDDNFVSLKVYNANGQEVGTVVNGNRHAGVNIVNFDATNLTSGLYFYTVKVGNVYSATKKMLLVK